MNPRVIEPTIERAREYVGTTPLSGLAQYALLQLVGVDHRRGVLEIGCGALHLAKPLLMLDGVRYVGVDPNDWLRFTAWEHDALLRELCRSGREDGSVDFSRDTEFYGWLHEGRADLAFSHSVLTHVSRAQLEAFMVATFDQADRVLCSVNLAATTTATNEWTYPEAVLFAFDEVCRAAWRAGWSDVAIRGDLRDFYMSYCPTESHDWIELTR